MFLEKSKKKYEGVCILRLKIVPNLTVTYLFAFLDYWKALKIKNIKGSAIPYYYLPKDVNRIN